jgi:hypothetical protein
MRLLIKLFYNLLRISAGFITVRKHCVHTESNCIFFLLTKNNYFPLQVYYEWLNGRLKHFHRGSYFKLNNNYNNNFIVPELHNQFRET